MQKPNIANFSWFSSLKNFLFTYKEAVKIAWRVRKDLFIATTVSNSLQGLLVFPRLIITKLFVDTVLAAITTKDIQQGIRTILILIFAELFIDLIRRGIDRFDWVFSQMLSRYVTIEVETRAITKLNKLPISLAESPKVRDVFRKIYDRSGPSSWGLIMPISSFPFALFSILASGLTLFSYNPLIVLPVILLVIPEIIAGAKNTKEGYRLETKITSLWRIGSAYEEFTSKGRYLYEGKILNHISVLVRQIWKIAHETFGERYRVWLGFGKRRFIASIPLGVVQTSIRGYLYFQAILGKVTLGTAQMQVQALGEFAGSISGLGRQINEVYENYLFVKEYREFLNTEDEDLENGEKIVFPLKAGIEFRDVWFKYPQGNRWTLKGVSFRINPKDNIAIVGPNGAGKTTIIKLLCKFYEPQKGEILVNDKNIKEYATDGYRQIISALFQDFAQYPFSANENIGFGDVARMNDLINIEKAARLVGIDEFIESLPKKYENALDNEFEGGIEPSKGQWQRLALARALFRNAEIFILDEPTSNVDPQAEEEIFEKIITLVKEKIIFLVSHRFSTVRKADKILVLDKGKIQEYGTHEELIKNKEMYARLFELQAKAYQEGS